MGLICSGISDVGSVRKVNQDAVFTNAKEYIILIADGVGGHQAGDLASTLAAKFIPEYLRKNSSSQIETLLSDAISFANEKIYHHSQCDPKLKGMGTTVSCGYFFKDSIYIGNVGDSRTYLIHKNQIFQLTRDHSLVQEKINLGIYTRKEAVNDPHKNILVRTVGFEEAVEADIFTYKVKKNDIFLSCSDGLHGLMTEEDILNLITQHIPDPTKANQQCLEKLLEALV